MKEPSDVPACSVDPIASTHITDAALEALLRLVYVGNGYTEPEIADASFLPANVRARGTVLVAHDGHGRLFGTVVVAPSDSPARRLAERGEAELHLLCVHPDRQRHGIGTMLVTAAIEAAQDIGATRLLLWTQPSMLAAQRLYARHGFERVPRLDFSRGERSFLVFARPI